MGLEILLLNLLLPYLPGAYELNHSKIIPNILEQGLRSLFAQAILIRYINSGFPIPIAPNVPCRYNMSFISPATDWPDH